MFLSRQNKNVKLKTENWKPSQNSKKFLAIEEHRRTSKEKKKISSSPLQEHLLSISSTFISSHLQVVADRVKLISSKLLQSVKKLISSLLHYQLGKLIE